jgi:hypothetical protein
LTAVIPLDDTIPQNTEGTEIVTASITPVFAASRILVRFQGFCSTTVPANSVGALFRDAAASALAASAVSIGVVGALFILSFEYLDSPSSTSALTYRVRVGPDRAATIRFNWKRYCQVFRRRIQDNLNPPGDQVMPDIVRGHTFVAGEVVEAESLNDLVSNAVIQPTLISQKVLKDPAALSDRILIEDSGALKAITIQQIIDLVTPSIVNAGVPIGTVADFAGANAPTGWFLCQGQAVDRTFIAICLRSSEPPTAPETGDHFCCQMPEVGGGRTGRWGRKGGDPATMSDSMGACWAWRRNSCQRHYGQSDAGPFPYSLHFIACADASQLRRECRLRADY